MTVSRELIIAIAITAAPACENVRFHPRENQLFRGSSTGGGSGLISLSIRLLIRHQRAWEFGGIISDETFSRQVSRMSEKSSQIFAHPRQSVRWVRTFADSASPSSPSRYWLRCCWHSSQFIS